jgi:hypothetical protein
MLGRKNKSGQYDAFEHLCADAFDDPKRGYVAVLTVYSDASYNQPSPTNPNPPLIHTVGCYIADVEDWKRFRRAWNVALHRAGLSDFHMKEFERARSQVVAKQPLPADNPYRRWRLEDFEPALKRFHKIIRRTNAQGLPRLTGFVSSVEKDGFNTTLPKELRDEPGCRSHYIFNVVNNMERICLWANYHRIEDRIHYVFAGGDNEGGNIERWFISVWRDPIARERYRLTKGYSRWGFQMDMAEGEPALQAADIAAYEFNKFAERAIKNGLVIKPDDLRKSVLNLAREPNPHIPLLLIEDGLRQSFAQMVEFKKKHSAAFVLKN